VARQNDKSSGPFKTGDPIDVTFAPWSSLRAGATSIICRIGSRPSGGGSLLFKTLTKIVNDRKRSHQEARRGTDSERPGQGPPTNPVERRIHGF
jgi:hypothetical protein